MEREIHVVIVFSGSYYLETIDTDWNELFGILRGAVITVRGRAVLTIRTAIALRRLANELAVTALGRAPRRVWNEVDLLAGF